MGPCVPVLLSEVVPPGIRTLGAEEPDGPGWLLLTGVPEGCDVRPRAVLKASVTSREPLEAEGVTTGTLTGIVGKRPVELVAPEPVLLGPPLLLASAVDDSGLFGVIDPVELGRLVESDWGVAWIDSVELAVPRRSDRSPGTRPGVDDAVTSWEFV